MADVLEPVAAGLWSVRVPIPKSPLRYVFAYVFETRCGPVVVDPGWNAEESYAVLVDALVEIGASVSALYGILVTHHHRDHSGLALRLASESGAYIGMHQADLEILRYPMWFADRIVAGELAADGVPADIEAQIHAASLERFPPVVPVRAARSLRDGEMADLPGWHVRAIWTPGHTPGHLCFLVEGHDGPLLLTGDHVLPRITPNVGITSEKNRNPLRDYRASLLKVLSLAADSQVLPAHEWPFADLPARIREIEEHHDARLAEVRALLTEGPLTTWQLANALTWKNPWTTLDPLGQRSALNETRAHVAFLRDRNEVVTTGEPLRVHALA